ncbi:MAG: methyltransferase domain-containing protein [Sedimentisphaerales bacterium]|nr:methyltransferase domain-containing protein [Sedimentisphaerales bacterium]
MSGPRLQSARAIAAETLRRFDPARDYAGTILDRLLPRTNERQRATDLVYGTIRHLLAIDAVIARFSGRRPDRIAPPLLSILRIGVYELAYSPATPAYSIVDEAVNNARHAGGKKQTGFVNAVLREIERHIVNREVPLATANLRRTLVRDMDAGCEFDADFLLDPAASLPEYLSTCFSLPQWLVCEWLGTFGPDQTRRICLASNRRPSLYVRVNPLRTTAHDLLVRFEQAGIKAEPAPLFINEYSTAEDAELRKGNECKLVPPNPPLRSVTSSAANNTNPPDMLRITSPQSVTELPGFSEGLFTVQDLSASQAVRMLAPQPGWTILDMCSAPGTKTTQIAELTRDAATIYATDIDAKRLERVQEDIARLGLKSITILPYAQLEQGAVGPFDAILLDVPCSNTGVLARRVEARYRLRPESVDDLATGQRSLLEKAATLLKPTGRLCYSTCSIQTIENHDLIQGFLATYEQSRLVHERLALPCAVPFHHDGGYVAVLRTYRCDA